MKAMFAQLLQGQTLQSQKMVSMESQITTNLALLKDEIKDKDTKVNASINEIKAQMQERDARMDELEMKMQGNPTPTGRPSSPARARHRWRLKRAVDGRGSILPRNPRQAR